MLGEGAGGAWKGSVLAAPSPESPRARGKQTPALTGAASPAAARSPQRRQRSWVGARVPGDRGRRRVPASGCGSRLRAGCSGWAWGGLEPPCGAERIQAGDARPRRGEKGAESPLLGARASLRARRGAWDPETRTQCPGRAGCAEAGWQGAGRSVAGTRFPLYAGTLGLGRGRRWGGWGLVLKGLPLPRNGVCVGVGRRAAIGGARPAISARGACVRPEFSMNKNRILRLSRGVYTSRSRTHTAAHATQCHAAGEPAGRSCLEGNGQRNKCSPVPPLLPREPLPSPPGSRPARSLGSPRGRGASRRGVGGGQSSRQPLWSPRDCRARGRCAQSSARSAGSLAGAVG